MTYSIDADTAIDANEIDANEIDDLRQMNLVDKPSNEFRFNLSGTLVSRLDKMAKYEGISSVELMIELVTEGLARRMTEDQSRPVPSHLMTRNGYVQDQAHSQPTMSHHSFQQQGQNNHGTQQNYPQQRYNRQHRPSRFQNNSRPSGYFRQQPPQSGKNNKKSEG